MAVRKDAVSIVAALYNSMRQEESLVGSGVVVGVAVDVLVA